MKRNIVTLLVAVLIVITGIASAAQSPFTDVPEGFWGYDDIVWASEQQLMVGTSEECFSPNADMTRAMLTAVLWRYSGSEDAEPSEFTDVKRDFWYTDGIDWASANGIVFGMTEDSFAPDASITREQIAAILYRYADFSGKDISGTDDLSGFSDSIAVSDWAKPAMQWAVAEKLIQGIDTVDGVCLVPRGNATRAQVCAILHRFDLLSKCVDGAEHQIAVDAAVEPTCTEDGLTEGSRCTVCNEVFTEQTVIPATGHTETTVPATEPTCTENGNTEYTVCQVCNETLTEGQVIEATGHSFGEFTVTKEPTYTEEGEQVKICTVCEFAQTEAIGMLVPENGLVYETEEYTYTYYVDHATGAADGWNAIVNDNTKTSYTKPESYIYGKPVTQLYKTYSGCKSLIAPPAIPETVSVLYNTYKNCTALTVAPEIPDTVNNMTFAFWGCSSLVTPPSLPAGVNLKGTFRNCSLLAYAPDVSKATDMEETFFGCTSLAGDAVLACDSNAKAYADTGISRVIIKPSVTKISSGAFDGCSKLVKVIYEGDTESYAALEIEGYNAAFNEAVFEFSTPQPLTVVQKNGNIHVIGLSSDINDLFVSEGTWDSYRDAADNRIARITSEDVNQSQVYVYKPGSPLAAGSYTVYVRYQDEAKAHSYFSFTVE